MTDRELLEAAARAAGIEFGIKRSTPASDALYLGPRGGWWNPLTDDGDALRLAIKLGINVGIAYAGTPFEAASYSWAGSVQQAHNGDPYAATRRAIVLAAAAIGGAP